MPRNRQGDGTRDERLMYSPRTDRSSLTPTLTPEPEHLRDRGRSARSARSSPESSLSPAPPILPARVSALKEPASKRSSKPVKVKDPPDKSDKARTRQSESQSPSKKRSAPPTSAPTRDPSPGPGTNLAPALVPALAPKPLPSPSPSRPVETKVHLPSSPKRLKLNKPVEIRPKIAIKPLPSPSPNAKPSNPPIRIKPKFVQSTLSFQKRPEAPATPSTPSDTPSVLQPVPKRAAAPPPAASMAEQRVVPKEKPKPEQKSFFGRTPPAALETESEVCLLCHTESNVVLTTVLP